MAVADLFGFHAVQLGMPELDSLRANRMPHRWVATEHADAEPPEAGALPRTAVTLHCDFDALPFDSHSLDLVVLPHALELARDPHLALREVERWMEELPPEQRAALVLSALEGHSNREVADLLGCSEGAVEQRLVRARATLRHRQEVP